MSPNAFAPRAVAVTCACALVAVVAPAAQAQPVHQVVPGESLWQIAAANGLSPAALAAANGLPADSAVLAGQVVRIPAGGGSGAGAGAAPGATATGAPPPAGTASGSGAGTTTATGAATASAAGAGPGSPATSGSSSGGSITVQPGDTLSAIAARAGVSVVALAGHNGLNASALLPAGRALALPGAGTPRAASSSAATTTAASSSSAAAPASPSSSGSASAGSSTTSTASPVTTPATAPSSPGGTRVTAAEVGAAATTNGVPASLARAIAWQESGFDNGAVSSAGARGAMQVMPDTLTWINGALSSRRLDSSSAADNVQAGTLYLQHLLRETGGDADQAAAAYYQGLSSVRRRGMYDDTKRYVANVRALRARFGG